MRHRAQPAHQRQVDAGAHALEDALEQVVVGRDEAGIDHAPRGIDDVLAGLGRKIADRRDAVALDADRAMRAHRLARQPGENPFRTADQCHASAPPSLSCHCPSASLESATMKTNNATPASVMRKSAANIRGMSSAKPLWRIS